MHFLYPTNLWALTLLAIPIIIHLVQLRRSRKVVFSNVSLLKFIETAQSTRKRLKDYLILASRLLALLFLILTFAGPYIALENRVQSRGTVLLFDNALNMLDQCDNIVCVEKLAEMVATYFEHKGSLEIGYRGNERALQIYSRGQLDLALEAMMPTLQDWGKLEQKGDLVIFSDFESSKISQMLDNVGDSSEVVLVPLRRNFSSNIYVDTVFLESVYGLDQGESVLTFHLKNSGNKQADNVLIRLYDGNRQVSSVAVDVEPQAIAAAQFQVGNTFNGKFRLTIDDPAIRLDNEFYLALNDFGKVKISIVNGGTSSPHLNAVFANGDLFELNIYSSESVDFEYLSASDLVILNAFDQLPAWVNLSRFNCDFFFIPSDNIDLDSYSRVLMRRVRNGVDSSRFDLAPSSLQHPFFHNLLEGPNEKVQFPKVSIRYSLDGSGDPLLFGEKVFLEKISNEFTDTYWLNGDLKSNMPLLNHAIFLPLMYRMAEKSVGFDMPLYHRITSSPIGLGRSLPKAEVFKLKSEHSEYVPEIYPNGTDMVLRLPGEFNRAGHYSLLAGADSVGLLAFNYPKETSFTNYLSDEELLEAFGRNRTRILDTSSQESLLSDLGELQEGKRLWKYALLLALMFFIAETAIHRWVK